MEDDGEVVGFHVEAVLSKVGPRFGPRTRDVVAVLQEADPREVYRRVNAGIRSRRESSRWRRTRCL